MRIILLMWLMLWSFHMHGQSQFGRLDNELTKSLDKDYKESDMFGFFQYLDSIRRTDLSGLKEYNNYKLSIKELINGNIYQRALAYRLLANTGDHNHDNILLKRMNEETEELPLAWLAMTLSINMPKETEAMFHYLVQHEEWGDAHFVPFYLKMDTTSIIATSYQHMNDTALIGRLFSLQVLGQLDKSAKADLLIKDAIKTWPDTLKGFAIVALGLRRKGGLKDVLSPYVNTSIPELRRTIKYTLEESPSKEDRQFAKKIELLD